MHKSKVPTFFWAILSIALLIAAGSLAYYFVIFLPSKEALKSEVQSQVQTVQEVQKKTDTQIRQDCYNEGLNTAQDKLKKLMAANILTGAEKAEAQRALDQGLAKKVDIDYYYNLCLEINGLK